jgi:hypothetical protein
MNLLKLLLGFIAFFAMSIASQANPVIRDGPSAFNSYLFGINNLGQQVGGYDSATTSGTAIVWASDGSYTTFTAPGGGFTYALDINDSGDIVGFYNDSVTARGYLRSAAGLFTSFDVPGASTTRAQGINNKGQIVGVYQVATTLGGFLREADGTFHLFQVSSATRAEPSKINDGGTIVGRDDGPGFFGTIDGGFTLFNAQGGTLAYGINDLGVIVGRRDNAFGDTSAFIRQADGSIQIYRLTGASTTTFYDINNSGVMVGMYQDGRGDAHGFILNQALVNTGLISTPGSASLLASALLMIGLFGRHCRMPRSCSPMHLR